MDLENVLKHKKVLFFDYDGTIADNEGVHLISYKKFLKQFGIKFTRQDFLDYCLCKPAEVIMTNLENKFNLKIEDREKFWLSFLETDFKVLSQNSQNVFPYVYEIFKFFPKMKKILISNESDYSLNFLLENVNLKGKFDVVYSCFKREPKAETLTKVKQVFNVDACDAVLFEDSQHNIDIAKSVGFTTVAIEHSLNKGIKADFVLKKGK